MTETLSENDLLRAQLRRTRFQFSRWARAMDSIDQELVSLRDRVNELLELRSRQLHQVEAGTHLDQVTEALILAGANGLTTPEIAELTGLDQRAVRVVLYTYKDLFAQERLSPRRVLWRIAENAIADIDEEVAVA